MENKVVFNQKDLILKVNKNYDKSKLDLDKWENYLDVLCGNRDYQKDAIRSSLIYLASGMYSTIADVVKENYNSNSELCKKYLTIEDYISNLQIPNKLFANIDLATGTGKSYVIFAIAQILLAEKIVKRVLVLCPSLTIEKGLKKKFEELSSNADLRNAIPEELTGTTARIISADSTICEGDICVENIHAVYETTGSSIKDSFKNGGEDTLVLNDESHHIFNSTSENDIKKWKEFLLREDYKFKYILGFTGTAYLEDEYFNDVIYRYSLRSAIDDRIVKTIDYVQKDDVSGDREYKFQKIRENHQSNKRKYPNIKPISILITKDISSAKNLYEDFLDFLCDFEKITREVAERKVLIVTSDQKHRANVGMLDFIDNKENSFEWIVSVSMLTEGWDVKNVFQIVPWEDRAFNSKLLIAQVLGRGLRIPMEYSNPQPSVTVFNHDSWSKNIKSLVNEVLEIETRIISTVKYNGDRNKYHFVVKNLSYDKEEKEINTDSTRLNYAKSWEEGIKLKSQILQSKKETEYENLLTGKSRNIEYNIKLRTKTINQVIDKIYHEFRLRDWETKILGLGDDVVYSKENLPPRDKIESIIRKSMKSAGITRDILIEENANKIFTAFSTLFRTRSKTVINSVKSTEFIDINTEDMRNETRGISSFRSADSMFFYTDKYKDEMPSEEQKVIVEKFVEDENFPKKAYTEINYYDFKTPLNTVIASADPEYKFLKKYLFKNENAQKIKSWVKSRDMGFYSIEYSYKLNSHTKVGTFNPDFIIKLDKSENIYLFIEIKDDGDNSPENKGKYKAAKEHFSLLNQKLIDSGINEKYIFHFLSPNDYEIFFQYLRDDKLDTFVSGLDNLLEEADK
ncbi:Type III restriction-modification system DNA endonuclease res [Streptococcus porcinus]|uniref:DEAD/DEAH box helicase n=1 Tax=Streptococcus porcinus TaxID=1340 RepID=UPI0010CACEB8|nr:DEAD/DEAH box helicase family protein [Streptococcus porcinus]VTS21817.1 Type III restriction-modification system DNA endonuclease res [Streptococcus porcinus]